MAKSSAVAVGEESHAEPELYVDFDEIVLLPMPKQTYRILSDAAFKAGKPMAVFVQELFDKLVAEALKR